MTFIGRIVHWFTGPHPAEHETPDEDDRRLREFVYLDEVSLRSLLSSQKGEVTEGTSEQSVDTMGGEIGVTAGASAPMLAKTEMASKFQTSNSSTLQTSRKATVQSWFREFHDISGLRLVEPVDNVTRVVDLGEIARMADSSVAVKSSELIRGALVEFRVRLNADPVFRLGTMVSEFTGMAEDHADMFDQGDTLASLGEAHRINKILQRLLAGLIPVRAGAVDYVAATIDGTEYLVHRNAIAGHDVEVHPVQIVGVTEHMAYWKDIRRVLFSDAEFTMLCRVSRSSLQPSWTPVKLADMFRDVAPDLVEQINAAGRAPLGQNSTPSKEEEDPGELRMISALRVYKDALLADWDCNLSDEEAAMAEEFLWDMRNRYASATAQRSAFDSLRKLLATMLNQTTGGTKDLEFREQARAESGLSLFPVLNREEKQQPHNEPVLEDPEQPRLLDVEVVAIYW